MNTYEFAMQLMQRNVDPGTIAAFLTVEVAQ